ncbi:unnamed protein product [Heterobilharzia americana]|nr:unnamed protein product [Heterobilharzia americana]
MYRRQQFDRLNPRNVLPSRHTLFIRGLPGSTDVAKVKDFFSNETNSRCSVEFFSTSEDKKRFSVAIRFKSHEIASEMLRRHSLPSNPGDSMNASESEFNGRNYDDRRISRNRSRHSRDPSSSSSRSSEEGRRQSSSNHHSESRNNARYGQSGGENSSPDYQARKNQRLSRSPSMNEENLAFSNAPAPNPEGGSSLGFEQSPVRGGSFSRRNRNSSENSSSGASVDSSTGAFESPRNHAGRKRVHSISPPYNDVSNRNTKTKAEAASNSDEKGQSVIEPQKRRKVKNTRSPANNTVESLRERPNTRSKAQRASLRKTDVESSATMRQANASRKHRSSAEKSSQKSSTKDSSPAPDKTTSKSGHNSRRSETTRSPLSTFSSKTAKRWRTPEDEVSDDQPRKGEKWPVTTNKTGKTKGKSSIPPANNSSDNDHFDASKIGGNQLTSSGGKDTKTTESLMPIPVTSNSTSSNDNTGSAAVVSGTATVTNKELGSGDRPDDIVNLIRDRKDALAEDYKRDCEAFTTVVRMLIR